MNRRGCGNRTPITTYFAGGVLLSVALVVIAGSWLAPYPPNSVDTSITLASPSRAHPLGTDYLGRDTLSRLLVGARQSILGSLEAVGVGVVLGVLPGLLSIFRARHAEFLLQRVSDSLMTLPFVISALALVSVFGNSLGITMLAVGIMFAPRFFRITRAACVGLPRTPYVEVAELFGSGFVRIVRTHVLRKIAPALLVAISTSIGVGILAVASVTFLGLGVPPPDPTWGGMLTPEIRFVFERPWAPFIPCAAVVVTVVSMNTVTAEFERRLLRVAPVVDDELQDVARISVV